MLEKIYKLYLPNGMSMICMFARKSANPSMHGNSYEAILKLMNSMLFV